ncbi:MAG: hypothetical protein AAGA48_05290 [Myxococcota bacterium]
MIAFWWVCTAFADDLPLRVIEPALVGRETPLPRAVKSDVERSFQDAVRQTWPDATAAGDARTTGPVSSQADPVVHVGLRVTRFEEDRVVFGKEKTVEALRATVAPFAIDLGTGEVIASAPFSFVVTSERLGTKTDSDAEALRQAFVETGVPRAVERFATGFAPDRLEARVVERTKAGAFIARGQLDGSFVGERLRTDSGEIVEVIETGARVSRVVSPTGGRLPSAGSTVVRPGLARPLGKAPRVLVAAPRRVPANGPDPEAVTMWVEEALAQAGWVVVPRGTELFSTQLREAASLDIPEASLLNAQTPPERVAIPRVWRLSTASVTDPTGAARLTVTTGLQVDVFDLSTGLLVQSTPVVELAEHDTRSDALEAFSKAMQVSVVKDAAVVLAQAPAAYPTAPLPTATLEKLRPAGFAWTSTAAPLPAGVIGEVQRPLVFEGPNGESLDGPAERIGVARVLGLEKQRIEAAWLAPGSAKVGDRFTPVGGRKGGPPVVIEPPVVSGGAELPVIDRAAWAGLHQAEGLAIVASDDDQATLDGVVVSVARSGFAGEISREPVSAPRTLSTQFIVKVTHKTKGRKRLTTVRVEAEARVTRDGEPVLLKPPSADEAAPVYTMWTQQTLETPVKRRARDLTVVDLSGTILETVHATASTLGQRVAVMLGG